MNTRRETARRWVIDQHKTDEELAHLIIRGYDEGPARIEMEGYVNEAHADLKWLKNLETAYRACGYQPDLDLVARKLLISEKTLRKQCRDHGIRDWRDVHARFA